MIPSIPANLQQNDRKALQQPSHISDLNPFEMLWVDLMRAVHKQMPKNLSEMKQWCKDKQAKILHNDWETDKVIQKTFKSLLL